MHTARIQDILDKQITASDIRLPRTSLRASDVGICPGQVYYQMLGHEIPAPDARAKRVFGIGTAVHQWVQSLLRDAGILVSSELKVTDPATGITGHCDGIIEADGRLWIVDFKTINSQGFHYFDKETPFAKEHHAHQIMWYKHVMQPMFTRELWPLVIYISKDDACLKCALVDNPEVRKQEALDFFDNMKRCVDSKIPPKMHDVIFDEGKNKYAVNWKSKYCPCHDTLCTGDRDWLKKANAEVRRLNSVGFSTKFS